jgi:hypothetical protein
MYFFNKKIIEFPSVTITGNVILERGSERRMTLCLSKIAKNNLSKLKWPWQLPLD